MQKLSLLSVAQGFLLKEVPGLSNNTARMSDGDMYVRRAILGASGILNIIDANTRKIVGESNFDGQKLPAEVFMALERIRFAYASCLKTATDKTVVGQNYLATYSTCPAALANAEFTISQNGTKIIELPVQRFLTNDDTQGLHGDDAYYLEALRLLKPQVAIEIQLSFPDGGTLDANKLHFIELHLIGPKSEVRGA